MDAFLHGLTTYPGIIPSILLGVLLVFWLLTIVGLLDLESVGPDWLGDAGAEVDGGGPASGSGMLVGLGFDRLPFSVVASAIVFLWWLLTMLGSEFLLSWLPLPVWLAGSGLLLLALVIALPFAAFCVRPLKPLFRVYEGTVRHSLPGRQCTILTQTVDEGFGQAEVRVDAGTPLNLRVWAAVPNSLSRGSKALIVSYDDHKDRFEVQALAPADS